MSAVIGHLPNLNEDFVGVCLLGEFRRIMTCGKYRDTWFTEFDADYKAWALDQRTFDLL